MPYQRPEAKGLAQCIRKRHIIWFTPWSPPYSHETLPLIPPLIQADAHGRDERQVHTLRDRDNIGLLTGEQLPGIEHLAINPRHRLTRLRVPDIGIRIEEIALHHQFLLLIRERVEKAADRF